MRFTSRFHLLASKFRIPLVILLLSLVFFLFSRTETVSIGSVSALIFCLLLKKRSALRCHKGLLHFSPPRAVPRDLQERILAPLFGNNGTLKQDRPACGADRIRHGRFR